MKKLLFFFTVIILTNAYSKEYSINDILTIFEKNNYDLKIIDKMAESYKKNMEMEQTEMMDTMVGYEVMDLTIKDDKFDTDMIKHKVFLKQEIPLSGKNYFKKKIAEIDYINTIEESKEKKLMLKRMLLNNIIELHINYEIEKNRNSELDLLKKAGETLKIQYSTGKAPISDIIESDIKITEALNMILMIKNMENLLKNEIIDILDISDDKFDINFPMNHKLIDISKINEDDLYNKSKNNFPAFNIKNNDIEKVNRYINLVRDEFVPDMSLMFNWTLKPSPMIENSFGLGIEFNLPLFSSISGTKKIDMFKEDKKQKELIAASYENEIKNYIKRKIIDLKSTIEQADLIENRIIKLSQNNVDTLFSAYQVEKIEFSELLSAIIMVYDSQNKYFEALGKIYKIIFDLEMLSGENLSNLQF